MTWTRERIVLTVALVMTLLTLLAGLGAIAATLSSQAVERPDASVASAVVGALFVGALVGLLPGCAAMMLVFSSALLSVRERVMVMALPPALAAIVAVVPAMVLGAASRTALTWAIWPAALAALLGGSWALWLVWRPEADPSAAQPEHGAEGERRTLIPGFLPFDPHSADPGVHAFPDFATDLREEEVDADAESEPGAWQKLREHDLTARIAVALLIGAVIVVLWSAVNLVRSAAYLPQHIEVLTSVLPPWYTTASGAFAAAFLWGPLWLVAAVLLQVSRRAGPAERKLAWLIAPVFALALALPIAVGWLLAGALSGGAVRAIVIVAILVMAVGGVVLVVRLAPAGAAGLARLAVGRHGAASSGGSDGPETARPPVRYGER